jgi:hypothetical protein
MKLLAATLFICSAAAHAGPPNYPCDPTQPDFRVCVSVRSEDAKFQRAQELERKGEGPRAVYCDPRAPRAQRAQCMDDRQRANQAWLIARLSRRP